MGVARSGPGHPPSDVETEALRARFEPEIAVEPMRALPRVVREELHLVAASPAGDRDGFGEQRSAETFAAQSADGRKVFGMGRPDGYDPIH